MSVSKLVILAITSIVALLLLIVAIALNTFTTSDNAPTVSRTDGKSEWGFDQITIKYYFGGEQSADFSYNDFEDTWCGGFYYDKFACSYIKDLSDASDASMAFFILAMIFHGIATILFTYYAITSRILTRYGKAGIVLFLVGDICAHISVLVWLFSAHQDIKDWIGGNAMLAISFWMSVLACILMDVSVYLSYKCMYGPQYGYNFIS